MTNVWDRRNARINYQVPVGLLNLATRDILDTVSINVSRGGLYVGCESALPVGTPLVCNVPIGRDTQAMQLRGRVAWVRPRVLGDASHPGGLGIEFVDLTDSESDTLESIVGREDDESHAVRLDIPSLAGPLEAQAQIVDGRMIFRAPLPLLELESEVGFQFEGTGADDTYRGRIVNVAVLPDPGSPIPRLQIEVELLETYHQEHCEIPAGIGCESTYDMMEIQGEDTEPTPYPEEFDASSPAHPLVDAAAELADVVLKEALPVPSLSGDEGEEDGDSIDIQVSLAPPEDDVEGGACDQENDEEEAQSDQIESGEIHCSEGTPRHIPQEESVQTELLVDDQTSPPQVDESAQSFIGVPTLAEGALPAFMSASTDADGVPTATPGTDTQAMLRAAMGDRRLWAASAAVVVAVVGATAFALSSDEPKAAGTEDIVGERARVRALIEKETPPDAEAEAALERIRQQAMLEERSEVPNVGVGSPLTSSGPKKEETEAVDSENEVAADEKLAIVESPVEKSSVEDQDAQPKRLLQFETDGIAFVERNDEVRFTVPMKGDLSALRSYRLASPEGIAINLADARPVDGFHELIEPEGELVRQVWIREKENGTHIRAYVSQPELRCSTSVEASTLIVSCTAIEEE